jgi:hypothetical protein
MATGDSSTVRSFEFSAGAFLEDAWAQSATAGVLRVRSGRLHDNLQGIRLGVLAATPAPMIADVLSQKLYPQDTLTIDQTGGGAETDAGALLIVYNDLPGVDANLKSWAEVQSLIVNLVSIETQHTTGSTAGDYGGAAAINSFEQTLKANTNYAVLGYTVSAAVCTVGYRGSDFGNLRIGAPGTTTRQETRDWFVRKSQERGEPWIPVFNSANQGNVFVDLASTATGATVNVHTMLAQLSV